MFCFSRVADKFIVSLTQLMALFTICPACCGETHGNVEQQQGTFVQIKQVRGYCSHIKVKMCANLYLYCIYCVFFVLSFLLYQFTFLTV